MKLRLSWVKSACGTLVFEIRLSSPVRCAWPGSLRCAAGLFELFYHRRRLPRCRPFEASNVTVQLGHLFGVLLAFLFYPLMNELAFFNLPECELVCFCR